MTKGRIHIRTYRIDSDHNVKVSEQIKTNVEVLFTDCDVNELELEGIITA